MLALFPVLASSLLTGERPVPHPLFRLDRPTMEAAYRRGHAAVTRDRKLGQTAFMRKWSLDVAKIGKGKKGWTAPFATLYCPAATSEQWGFRDGREHESDANFRAYLDGIQPEGMNVGERIHVFVRLYAWPGVGSFGEISRQAKQSDVRDVKFGLFVDGKEALDHTKAPERIDEQSGSYTTYSTSKRYVDVSTAYGSGTVSYSVENSFGNPYYIADYKLEFYAYRKDETCAVPPETRKLTLKAVRREFDQIVDIDLAQFARLLPVVPRPR